ncbi:MAG: DHH family phosphoesterase, partial [Desulfobacteraceae bacterium]|nr:DHH family phosphoesterase [Desulfobacteraceae bacterium]
MGTQKVITHHELNKYLLESKTHTNCKPIDQIVMGNEAADLDSMASSIVYAYFLNTLDKDSVVPIIPIPRADFKLRTEAVYVFEQAGIDLNYLIFMDDVNFEKIMKDDTRLVLVDHNRLSTLYKPYGERVCLILDHHRDEGLYPNVHRVIEPVGSTATLVGEELINHNARLHNSDPIDENIAVLLCGTILLDTVNLSPKAQRATPRDEKIVTILLESCPLDRDGYFKKIQEEKFNTSNLNTFDLLRKDYKKFEFGQIRCGIASTLLPLVKWGKNDNALCPVFESYAQKRSLDLLLSMNAYIDPGFNRDLAVFAKDEKLHHG